MERAEKIGLGIATAGHVLLFGVLSAGFLAAPKPIKLPTSPMDVSIVDQVALESSAPRVSSEPPPPARAPERGAPEEAAPSPPEPKAAPIPPPPPSVPKPPPPKAATPAKPVERARPLPPAPPVNKKTPPIKAPPPKERTDSAPQKKVAPPNKPPRPSAAAGAGKSAQTRGPGLPGDLLKGITPEAPSRPARSDATASATKLSASEARALNAVISEQIYRHLRLPSGADVEQLVAMLDVKLDKSGAVVGMPQVLDVQGVTESNRPQIGLYKERAIQAVLQASPFKGLPPDHWNEWRWLSPLRVYARKAQ